MTVQAMKRWVQALAATTVALAAPAALAQQGATLELVSDDAAAVTAGVDVWVNQLPQGRLPLTLRLPPGTYEVIAQSQEGRQWREKITLQAGEARALRVVLTFPAPPPPPQVPAPRAVELDERAGFIGIGFGTGSSYGGLVGACLEGGFRWLTAFASLGYWPALDLGVTRVPAAIGGEVGARLSIGGRRFKFWTSLQYGTGSWGAGRPDMAVGAWTYMLGGRIWFGGERRRFFIHAGLGVTFPALDQPVVPTFGSPVTAFDLGFGFDFAGR